MSKPPTKRQAIAELAVLFNRSGYIRPQNPERLNNVGSQVYKKGYEVRLGAHSIDELTRIQKLLMVLGFRIARPFSKASHFRQPIYGRAQVEEFLSLIGHPCA